MMDRRVLFAGAGALAVTAWVAGRHGPARAVAGTFAVMHTDAQWRKLLTPAQYDILRQQGTEPPFSSPLDLKFDPGIYSCVGCGQDLFSSKTKFDSHTGWPSFWAPLKGAVATSRDGSLGMDRTEVHCSRCGGHLGHVFDDGPPPTGLRYCMDGLALKFTPATRA